MTAERMTAQRMWRRTERATARLGAALGRTGGSGPTEGMARLQASMLELARRGPAPLERAPADPAGPLRVAAIIPSFRRGSGGHRTIARLLSELRRAGHDVSLWLEDVEGRHVGEREREIERTFHSFFGSAELPVHAGFDAWQGADVLLATGWQTVARALLAPGAGARAYLVQDHEPDFYGASAEALWAGETYRWGLHCIAASPWLAGVLRTRYGASASSFDLGVDAGRYRPPAGGRREQLVIFYARVVTPRRAVPLGLTALAELSRRRPGLDIALYGDTGEVAAPFAHRSLGLLEERRLAELYGRARVGVVLSLTNPSLINLEMMAGGLPCVELASESMLASFGQDSPLELARPDPLALCDAVERLLDDRELWESASRRGVELARARTWPHAARQVEQGLRAALSLTAQRA